jgi:hypothetical protein
MVIPERLEKMSESEFRAEIMGWIRTHYSGVLGSSVNLLKTDGGLDVLRGRVRNMMKERGMLDRDENKKVA